MEKDETGRDEKTKVKKNRGRRSKEDECCEVEGIKR